jgi:hypothetical protein
VKIQQQSSTLLKQKHDKEQIQAQMVLNMFFFWNQKSSLFEKNVLFSGTNHVLCLKE